MKYKKKCIAVRTQVTAQRTAASTALAQKGNSSAALCSRVQPMQETHATNQYMSLRSQTPLSHSPRISCCSTSNTQGPPGRDPNGRQCCSETASRAEAGAAVYSGPGQPSRACPSSMPLKGSSLQRGMHAHPMLLSNCRSTPRRASRGAHAPRARPWGSQLCR